MLLRSNFSVRQKHKKDLKNFVIKHFKERRISVTPWLDNYGLSSSPIEFMEFILVKTWPPFLFRFSLLTFIIKTFFLLRTLIFDERKIVVK